MIYLAAITVLYIRPTVTLLIVKDTDTKLLNSIGNKNYNPVVDSWIP